MGEAEIKKILSEIRIQKESLENIINNVSNEMCSKLKFYEQLSTLLSAENCFWRILKLQEAARKEASEMFTDEVF